MPPLPKITYTKSFWILFLAGVFLRLAFLGKSGLYYDEVLCLNDALSSSSHIFSTPHFLYFLLLGIPLKISQTEFFLRLTPAIFNLLSLFLIYRIGFMEKGEIAGVFFSVIFLFSEYITFYSMDADYYSGMIFFTLLSVLGMQIFLKYFRWLFFLIFTVASVLNFFIHPFSGLFSGLAFIAGIIYLFASKATRENILNLKIKRNSISITIIFLVTIIILIIGGQRIFAQALYFLKNFRFASWAHNLDFNFYFFFMTFKQYGPSQVYENIYAMILAPIFFIIFIIGLISLKREKSPLFILTIFPILFTFAFIFNTGITRFYHIRYTSYIVPLYLIGIGSGLLFISEIIEKKIAPVWHFKYSLSSVLIFVFVLFGQSPFTTTLLLKDYGNWKKVMEALSKDFSDKSQVFVFNEPDDVVAQYYLKRYRFSPEQVIWTKHNGGGQRDFAFFDLKRQVLKNPDTFFISAWTEIGTTHPEMLYWVNKYFKKITEAPSRSEISLIQYYEKSKRKEQKETAPHQTATLYRWNFPNTFLLFPYPLKIDITKNINRENIKIRIDESLISAEIGLLIDSLHIYNFEIRSKQETPPFDSATILLSSQNKEENLTKEGTIFKGRGELKSGVEKIKLKIVRNTKIDLKDVSLLIYPAIESGFTIPLTNYDAIQPSDKILVREEQGKKEITLKNNGFISYPFYLNEDGNFIFEIEGKNDKPNPVLWEVWFGSSPHSLIAFTKMDNSIEKKMTVASLKSGEHTISLFFISEGNTKELSDDQNTDGVLYSVTIAPSKEEAPQPFFVVEEIPIWSSTNEYSLASGWNIRPLDAKFSILAEGQTKILSINVPPKSIGVNLIPPLFNINEKQFFIASIDIKTKKLMNHSTNVLLAFLNKNGELLGRKWAYAQGLSGTTEWVTFVIFTPTPKDIASIAIIPSIYPNSNRPSTQQGAVSIRNLKIH